MTDTERSTFDTGFDWAAREIRIASTTSKKLREMVMSNDTHPEFRRGVYLAVILLSENENQIQPQNQPNQS